MEIIYYSYMPQNIQTTNRVMTVIGASSITLSPDTVQVHLEVQTENEKLTTAQQENATTMNQVIEALLNVSVDQDAIQTVSYTITPQYDYIDGEQRFKGYAVSNVIQVTSVFIEKIGSMIDVAVENGANGISNLQFFVENEEVAYEKALSEALMDAKKKAQTMAETMQLQTDAIPIKIVEERRENPIVPRMFVAKEMTSTTPIEPGQLTIQAAVTVQFQY